MAAGEHRAGVYRASGPATAFSAGTNRAHAQAVALRVAVGCSARRAHTREHIARDARAVFSDLVRVIDGQRHVVLRGDGYRDGGIPLLVGARSLRACISGREVAVIEAVAQGHVGRWHIAVAGIGDGAGHSVDRCAAGIRSKGNRQRACAEAVGPHDRAAIADIAARASGGSNLPCCAALVLDADDVLRTRTKVTAAAAGNRQCGAKECVYPLGDQFHITNRHAAIEQHRRANHAAVTRRIQTFSEGRCGVQTVDCGRVINRRHRHIDRVRDQRVGCSQSGANAGDVGRAAIALGRGVPRPNRQRVADRSVVVLVGLEVDPPIGRCNQAGTASAGNPQRIPVGAVVGRVVPGAVALVGRYDRNAFDCAVVHVADAAHQGRYQCADRTRRYAVILDMRDREYRRAAEHRRIVGTVDGDHQIRTAAVAVRIRDGVDKGLSQRLAGIECVDRGVGVVDAVAVAAIGVDRQAAISAVKGRSHRLVCATKADGTDRRGRAVSSDAVSHIICATSGKDVTSGAGRRRRGAFADAVGVGVGRGHVVNDANGQCGAAGAATFIEDRQGNAVRGLCNPRLAQVGFERVAVGQCARGGDAPDTGAAGVAAQRQCAFARVNHHLCGGQIAQLGTAHRGATNGDAGQSVKRRDRHGTGGGLSGVA